MKQQLLRPTMIIVFTFLIIHAQAQDNEEHKLVERACLDYIEGFYEGDTTKIIRSVKPSLYKYGYWKDKGTNEYEGEPMTFQEALDYSKRVLETKKFAPKDTPKKVEVFEVSNHIASAKITAWWGIDYLLLSKKENGGWIIEQVLWEGPLNQN